MYNDVITLISTTKALNEIGDITETETRREVFAKVKSVGSKRKLEALAFGLRLAWKFVLADYYDYCDEETAEYDGEKYSIIDTYRTDQNEIELTVTRC